MNESQLSTAPLFSSLGDDSLCALERALQKLQLRPGEVAARAGEKASALFVVAQGSIRLLSGGGKEIARLGPGALLAEEDALEGGSYSFTIEAITAAQLLALPISSVEKAIVEQPALAAELSAALGKKPTVIRRALGEWLRRYDQLRKLSSAEMSELANALQRQQLPAGTDLAAALRSGLIVVESGQVQVVGTGGKSPASSRVLISDEWLIAGHAPVSAEAETDVAAWYIPASSRRGLSEALVAKLSSKPQAARPQPSASRATAAGQPLGRQRRRLSAKWLRLAAAIVLATWLVAACSAELWQSMSASASASTARDLAAYRATAAARTPLSLALMPTATFAPSPTWLPTATATSTPTAVPPTPTPRPQPTNTPAQSAAPGGASAPSEQPQPQAPPTPTAAPTPTPKPAVDYQLVSWRQLTPCENHGMHNIFINVVDPAGNGIPGVRLWVSWGSDGVEILTGSKPELGPGWAVFDMFKGTYWVKVNEGTSDITPPLTVDIPKDEPCPETNNPVGNSLYHYSYEVIFQRTW